MRVKKIKSKKIIPIVLSIILGLIALGILIYFCSINKKVEISTQPLNVEEQIQEETDGEYIDINELEETQENVIDENIENNEKDNNVINKVTNTNTNTNSNAKNNTTPYYIKVNYGAQVVTIYKKDENGDYTVPVKAMVCSTGVATPTSGVYSIPARWRWLALFGDVYGQYSTQIKGNILFHSVPYLRKGDPASLEYWEYDKLGTAASAGCVRLTVADAMWIYNNCAKGTKVEFYSSSNPGPLGKPSAKKISSYPDSVRNWDPTDPDSNNPWKNYQEPKKTDTNNNKTNAVVQNNTAINNSNVVNNEVKEDKNNSTIKNEIINNEVDKQNEIKVDQKNDVVKNETKNNLISNNSSTNNVIKEINNNILINNI